MATITKTFTENEYSSNKSTWTVTLTASDIIADGSTIDLALTAKAKYTGSSKGYAKVEACPVQYTLNSSIIKSLNYVKSPSDYTSWASGAEKTLDLSGTSTVQTSAIFNSNTKTLKTITLVGESKYTGEGGVLLYSSNSSYSTSNSYYQTAGLVWGNLRTVTLDAPPQVTLGTPTYATPHYAGLGAYTVPLTTLTAQYGGDITSVTLTVGADSTTQTYSASTVSNKTISVTPSIAGTYTPTLTVTDSRGQTTTTQLSQITVNAYTAPSVNFDVYRTNSSGVKDDEGTYGLVKATINFTSAVASLTQPSVKIDGTTTNNVTWYSSYSESTGVSSAISNWSNVTYSGTTPPTVYGLINGSFQTEQSYQITVTETDSQSGTSQPVTQALSTAFYTIDFQAGGKEIAFGAPANDTLTQTQQSRGLFKCEMESNFNGDAYFNGAVYGIRGSIIGEIKTYAGITVPTGWLECDGSAVSRTDYADLFTAIGTLWGEGDGSTTFNLPNLQGRAPIGASTSTEWITIMRENSGMTFTLDTPTYCRIGTGTTWSDEALLPAGTYTASYSALTAYFPTDPASGASKVIQAKLAVGSTAGENEHKITAYETPAHTHGSKTLTGHWKDNSMCSINSVNKLGNVSGICTVATTNNTQYYTTSGRTQTSKQIDQVTVNATHEHTSFGNGLTMSLAQPFAVVKYIICAV